MRSSRRQNLFLVFCAGKKKGVLCLLLNLLCLSTADLGKFVLHLNAADIVLVKLCLCEPVPGMVGVEDCFLTDLLHCGCESF